MQHGMYREGRASALSVQSVSHSAAAQRRHVLHLVRVTATLLSGPADQVYAYNAANSSPGSSCRDLVFIWSRLHLRAHPCRRDFLDGCLQLASGATNVRAIFPFIKLVTTEVQCYCDTSIS